MAIATDGCNVTGRHIFLAQKLEAKIVSLVSVHCHAHRLASASYYAVADLCSIMYETTKALSCNCGSVLLFHRYGRLAWRCIMHQIAIKTDRQFYLTSEKIRYQGEENDRKVFESSSPSKHSRTAQKKHKSNCSGDDQQSINFI